MEKKSSSLTNIFVYLLMFFLILIIIMTPLLRLIFKDNSSNEVTTPNDQVTTASALTCQKEVTVGQMVYDIRITSNYGNDILNKVTFIYTLPDVTDTTIVDDPIMNEITTIRNSMLVEETTTDNKIKFVLTKEVKETNPTNTTLDAYYNPLDLQRTNLETLGYSCQVLTA